MCELRRNRAADDARRLQSDIDRIVEWCDRWLMRLDIDKCKLMHIGHKNPKITYYMKDANTRYTYTTIYFVLMFFLFFYGYIRHLMESSKTLWLTSSSWLFFSRIINLYSLFKSEILKLILPRSWHFQEIIYQKNVRCTPWRRILVEIL